ncbi:C4-dicarboxylate-specific signal transduction histidine kinase [Ochrobactrum anthropi]|uniref:sensor histidine kinase n=1 Tax=Brucella TaxID=234 RepID=UPI00180220B6|nr:ATP-binding protein [Brucella anthropi]MBA8862868.1 C4-dicarboxylate-specific signal transduction histidine kinase [Brucella anthropi]
MNSVANMVAKQNRVIELASRYRIDPPGFSELTREERAAILTNDPLVRLVGDFMTRLSDDLRYARIYMNNLSHDTLTSSQWADSFNIVGQIYTGRAYLVDALRDGSGQLFGIARLNQMPSYFVTSRIEDADDQALGSVTVRFDAPVMAHYLTGRHIALIVNRQGRVTTASSATFMLRNVAAVLPPETLQPSNSDEGPGEAVAVHQIADVEGGDQWMIDGHPYLVRRQPLGNAQYQLLTLASLDHLGTMQRQHLVAAGVVAAFGLALIVLSGRVAGQRTERRQREEQDRILAISQAAERELTIKVRERTAELAESNASLKAEVKRRRLLELKLKQSLDSVNDALAQQQDFVAFVSHEFRGPLGVIAAAADNLLISLADGTDSIKLRIAKISRTVKRMALLVENVLAGNRINAGQPQSGQADVFDLNEIIRTARMGLDDVAADRIDFVRGEEAPVKGDRTLIEIVLHNLIQNALIYSDVKSSVKVQLSTDNGVALVTVTDQGKGVASDDRELIFMKYFRSSGQNTTGFGLGLYISREIARQSEGDVTLTASDAHGSTFCLSLPIHGGIGAGPISTAE